MKRHLRTASAAALLLVAAVACGQQQPGTGAAPPVAPGPAVPEPEQQRQAVPAAQLAPGSPQVWTQDGGSVAVIKGKESGCSRVRAESVSQDPGQVKLALVEEKPDPPKICTMDIRYPPVAVRLEKPLDQRSVVVQRHEVKVPSR